MSLFAKKMTDDQRIAARMPTVTANDIQQSVDSARKSVDAKLQNQSGGYSLADAQYELASAAWSQALKKHEHEQKNPDVYAPTQSEQVQIKQAVRELATEMKVEKRAKADAVKGPGTVTKVRRDLWDKLVDSLPEKLQDFFSDVALHKTLTWRAIGTADTMMVSMLATGGNGSAATGIGIAEVFTKIGLYYGHEKFWEHVVGYTGDPIDVTGNPCADFELLKAAMNGKPDPFKPHEPMTLSNAPKKFVNALRNFSPSDFAKRIATDRALQKTISWRTIAFADTFLLGMLFTGSVAVALTIAGGEIVTKFGIYFAHEKAWDTFGPAKLKGVNVAH